MTTTDRTPIILALLSDLIRERVEQQEPDADLAHLSDGLALAVDHGAVAAMWPTSGVDERIAEWCLNIIDGTCDQHPGASDDARCAEISVARRLADVAASLLVRGDVHRAEAGALWGAAERLLGLQEEAPEQVDRERLQAEIDRLKAMHTEKRVALRDALGIAHDNHDHAGLCERVAAMRAEWDDLRRRPSEMKSLRADLASMTEQRDLLKRQLEELRGDMQKGTVRQRFIGGKWSDVGPQSESIEPNPDNRDSYRSTVLRAGAKDCALYIGPGPSDLTFVVEMREGSKVFDVVAALEHHHGLAPESYRIREVRTTTSAD